MRFGTDGGARRIVSVEVTNNGSDGGQMSPMHDTVCEKYDPTPENSVVNGSFSTIDDITAVEERGRRVAAPMTNRNQSSSDLKPPSSRV